MNHQNVYRQLQHKFHKCPVQFPASRYRSSCPPSFGHTSSILFFPVHQNVPSWPIWEQVVNLISKPAVHLYVFSKCQQVCRFVSTSDSSFSKIFNAAMMLSSASKFLAAFPRPPYTINSSGRSATSGFKIVQQHSQCCFLYPAFAVDCVPVGVLYLIGSYV